MAKPVETPTKSAVVTLEKALDIIQKRGWRKFSMVGPDGSVCLLQAIESANGPGEYEAKRIIRSCIGWSDIAGWNDSSTTTIKDVETVLKAAKHIAQELADA